MKNTIFISIALLILSATIPCNSQTPLAIVWDEANTAYVNSQYVKAINIYDSIADAGYVSDKLYYNLGNAYFKQGETGKAILYYNRALRLNPADPDTKHNLKVANTYIKDNIEVIPEFFLSTWIRSWKLTLSSNGWAVISLLTILLALSAVLVFLLSRNQIRRKIGFYSALICLLVTIFAISFSVSQKRQLNNSSEAIIMSSAVPIKSSPDNSSKDIFILHEGTKVKITSTLHQWVEISIADGNKGWIQEGAIEII